MSAGCHSTVHVSSLSDSPIYTSAATPLLLSPQIETSALRNFLLGAPEKVILALVMDEDALPRKRARLEAPEETEDQMAAGSRIALLLCGSFSPITNLHLRMFGGF